MSPGIVSAVARQLKPDDPVSYIQTDAPINPGNGGGPLIDADGRVVSINTLILTQSGGSEGIGFAIPSNLASRIFRQLKTIGHLHRLPFGLVVQSITPSMADGLSLQRDQGVIVSDVEPGGPAAQAGIQTDDIILAMNGKLLESAPQLDSGIYRQTSGETISLQILRGEQVLDLKVSPEEKSEQFDALADLMDPAANVTPQLGFVGLDVTKAVLQLVPDLRRPAGVVVAAHIATRSYSGPTLETGDVIYAMNRGVVSTVSGLRGMLDRLKAGGAVVLLVEREGKLTYVPLELE